MSLRLRARWLKGEETKLACSAQVKTRGGGGRVDEAQKRESRGAKGMKGVNRGGEGMRKDEKGEEKIREGGGWENKERTEEGAQFPSLTTGNLSVV